MRVIVEFDDAVRPLFIAWRASLAGSQQDRELLSSVFMDELKRRLVESGGKPLGSFVEPGTQPECHWIELAGGAWVGYTLNDRSSFFSRIRWVRIIDLRPHPPRA